MINVTLKSHIHSPGSFGCQVTWYGLPKQRPASIPRGDQIQTNHLLKLLQGHTVNWDCTSCDAIRYSEWPYKQAQCLLQNSADTSLRDLKCRPSFSYCWKWLFSIFSDCYICIVHAVQTTTGNDAEGWNSTVEIQLFLFWQAGCGPWECTILRTWKVNLRDMTQSQVSAVTSQCSVSADVLCKGG